MKQARCFDTEAAASAVDISYSSSSLLLTNSLYLFLSLRQKHTVHEHTHTQGMYVQIYMHKNIIRMLMHGYCMLMHTHGHNCTTNYLHMHTCINTNLISKVEQYFFKLNILHFLLN